MVSLTVSIAHTPWDAQRRAWITDIRRHWHEARVVSDWDRAGCWPTVRRAWLDAGRGTHHMVMADDMLPVPSCRRLLLGALEAKPDVCLSPFCMKRCTLEAVAAGKHWATSPDAVYGGATVLPTAWVAEWLSWDRAHLKPDYPHDDVRLAIWLVQTGRCVWYTAPSLFEHAGAAVGLHPNRNRVATILADGAPIDWARGLTDPVHSPGKGRSLDPKAWKV